MLTVDTITEGQIRQLKHDAGGTTHINPDPETIRLCALALGEIPLDPAGAEGAKREARARCAGILNAREEQRARWARLDARAKEQLGDAYLRTTRAVDEIFEAVRKEQGR